PRSAPGARPGVARGKGDAGPPACSPRKRTARASKRVVLERPLVAALCRDGPLAHRHEAPLVHGADDDLQAVAEPGERGLDLRRPQLLDPALHDADALQLLQLVGEGAARNALDLADELVEPLAAPEQVPHHHRGPAAPQERGGDLYGRP